MLLFFHGGNGTWSLYSRQALYPLATYPTVNLHFLDHTEHLHLFCNKPWFWSQFKTLPWPLRLSENILSWCHFARSCISGCNSFCSDPGKLSELWRLVSDSQDTGLYYDEYLKQVIDVLETDQHFREKLQKADIEEIRVSGVQQWAWQKKKKSHREMDRVAGSVLLYYRGVEHRPWPIWSSG